MTSSTGLFKDRWARLAAQFVSDLVVTVFCYWAAYWFRLDSVWSTEYAHTLILTWPFVVGTSLAVFFLGGIYREIWHLAHIQSAFTVVRCVLVATAISWITLIIFKVEPAVPRSVFPIYAILTIFLVGASRFTYRYWVGRRDQRRVVTYERCLIYGAGMAGDLLLRHIEANRQFPFKPVGFLDDDHNKRGRLVHGLRVLGSGEKLGEIAERFGVKTIIIAMHSAPGRVIRDVVTRCQLFGINPLIMPDMANSLGDDVFRPRSVDIKDLLRRSAKTINHDFLASIFHKKTVFVSGAGGSIGSEICRQILRYQPGRLVMLDASEYNLYRLETELEDMISGPTVCDFVLGSTTDRTLIERLFGRHKPSLVLHAAAYKHVPIIERNPLQGVINNILGTKVLAEAAIHHGVEKFLLISTDKAVRPTSVMGSTKRACELLVQAYYARHSSTGFSAVRFGNVLGSSGSVVPRFLQQIQAGGPVTVTHQNVTRYFMLISEAVALVLQAIGISKGGEIFVLDMGEPVRIYDMARQLIKLSGKEPGRDIEISVTGLRPGEKLYEELILETSECKQIFEDLYIALPEPVKSEEVFAAVDQMIELADAGREEAAVRLLRTMVSFAASEAAASSAFDAEEISAERNLH